jgi:hypothetical protein
MSGAIHPLPQYAFMAWCLVKAQGQLYFYFTFTPNIIRPIKSREMWWTGHVARIQNFGLRNWGCHFGDTMMIKVKGKVVPVLSFNWAPRHEDVLREWKYNSKLSLTSALDLGERSASRPGSFTLRERVPSTHWIEAGWAPQPFWTRWWREKFPAPAGNRTLEPRSFSPQPSRSTDWATNIKVNLIDTEWKNMDWV